MILILSSPDDRSTFDVIDWLILYKEKFVVLYEADNLRVKFVDIFNKQILIQVRDHYTNEDIDIDFSAFSAFWYRRGRLSLSFDECIIEGKDGFQKKINNYLSRQLFEIEQYIYFTIERMHGFGRYSENYTNKLINLQIAKESGLKIPLTYITTDGVDERLSNFELITKPIASDNLVYNEYSIAAPTVEVTSDLYKEKHKFPSLLQKNIKKKYELRIFHLDGRNFASVIFSQKNVKTKTDFRNYDNEKPNRLIPFSLPNHIELSINTFMAKIAMKSGSLDILVDLNNDYYFLEVNPIGQFGMISYPCNYNIEKNIAEYLTNYEKERNI